MGKGLYRFRVGMGDFSIAPKIEFLRRELTIGHVGIVQKVTKTNKSARLNVHTLSMLAPFFRGRVLRDTPPCVPPPLTYQWVDI